MAQYGVNKCIIIGRVGKDPEVRYAQSGTAFANLSLATSESWKDKNTGEQREQVEWHNVAFMGKLAEIVGEYVKKGSKIYVEGKLRTRKWQDQNGKDRYTTEIAVGVDGVMQMLDSRQDGQQQSAPQQQSGGWGQPQQPQGGVGQVQQMGNPPIDFDDGFSDIPF